MKHQVLGYETTKVLLCKGIFHKLTHFKESNVEKEIGLDLDSHRFSWGSLEVYNQC